MFHGLSDLFLADVPERFKPFVSEVIDIMEHCPRLQYLCLDNAGPKFTGSLENRTYSADKLRDISMCAVDFRASQQFFKCVATSKDVYCSLFFPSYSLDKLAKFIPRLLGEREVCMGFDINLEKKMLAFQAFSNLHLEECFDIGLEIHELGSAYDLQVAFAGILLLLSQPFFQSAAKICILFGEDGTMDQFFPMEEDMWIQLFLSLSPKTEELVIYLPLGTDHMEMDISREFTVTIYDQARSILAFPNLKTVEINFADFSTPEGDAAY